MRRVQATFVNEGICILSIELHPKKLKMVKYISLVLISKPWQVYECAQS